MCPKGVKLNKPDVANLSVTTHGSVSWNDERMGDEQLAQGAAGLRAASTAARGLHARQPAWWAYQRVAQVLAAAQKSGG